MAYHKRLTQDEIDAICHSREAGASVPVLARRYGVSRGAIDYRLLMNGVLNPKALQSNFAQPRAERREIIRGGRVVRWFTAAEDAFILEKSTAGMSEGAIGRLMDPPRPRNSIVGRLATLARHEEWQIAQEEKQHDAGVGAGNLGVRDRAGDPGRDRRDLGDQAA